MCRLGLLRARADARAAEDRARDLRADGVSYPGLGFNWLPKLKTAYFGFYRPGTYYCCGLQIRKEQLVELWIKMPLPPEELRALGHDVPDQLSSR